MDKSLERLSRVLEGFRVVGFWGLQQRRRVLG